jgi:DNA polymerase sigma
VRLQQQDFSALRPLVVVLKSILKQNGLGDVAFGGLGSWSLANMVIAHLMVSLLALFHYRVAVALATTSA